MSFHEYGNEVWGILGGALIFVGPVGSFVLDLPFGLQAALSLGQRSRGQSNPFSKAASKAIKKAGLDGKRPFADLPEDAVRNAFKYAAKKMYAAGALTAPYSVHDIRHYFAIREYRKDKDIYRLKVLLNHASIQVTENYLRGLSI